jgi:hypothetical protein
MKSFFFWLATASAIGALAGIIVRPGPQEIVIIWAALVGLYYLARSWGSHRRTAKA